MSACASFCLSTIGGHLVRYPWSAISDWAWYQNFRYRTERVESDIISDIGIKFYPISDILFYTNNHSSSVLLRSHTKQRVLVSNLLGEKNFSSMSDIRMSSDVDIGTVPISEWHFSVRHICLRYRNNRRRCRCRMSEIADIEIDVDAHLCCLPVYFPVHQKLFFLYEWVSLSVCLSVSMYLFPDYFLKLFNCLSEEIKDPLSFYCCSLLSFTR